MAPVKGHRGNKPCIRVTAPVVRTGQRHPPASLSSLRVTGSRTNRGDLHRLHSRPQPADPRCGTVRAAAPPVAGLQAYVMLPGMKQRIKIPPSPRIGQTIVRPTRLGEVITASSGTSSHLPSSRTR